MSTYRKSLQANLGKSLFRGAYRDFVRGLSLATVGLLCLQVSPVFADAYLDALNSAASGLEVDPDSSEDENNATQSGSIGQASGANMPVGLSREGFEEFLEKRFFGSFAFYEKLNKQKQDRVFNAYGGKPNIRYIREQIKRQYLRNGK